MNALAQSIARYPSIPYIAPFAVFMSVTALQPMLPDGLTWIYPVKTLLTVGALIAMRGWFPTFRPYAPVFATVVGIVTFAIWIAPEGRYPLLSDPEPFDPFAAMTPGAAWSWIAVRLFGATVVVAVMEELFWRGFLIRWIINPDFRSVQMGTFTWTSFVVTTLLFASEHNRWLVGLVAGVIYNGVWYRTRSVGACIIAHAVTNLALGVFVIVTERWEFW